MFKFSVILTSLRKSGRFPIPVKVGATPIGTAAYDNNRASHFLKIDGDTFLKHAEGLCSMAKGGNAWYAAEIEIESEATSRETELMAEIDRLQRELFDAHGDISQLKGKLEAAAGADSLQSFADQADKSVSAPKNGTVEPEALTQKEEAVSPVKQAQPAYTEANLLALNMREQRSIAKDLGVPSYTKAKTEKELVAMILAHVQADQDPEGNG